jgi:adenosine kinase
VQVPAAPSAAVVDPTGAGDAYVAGLLAGLRRGLPLEDAGRMAALSATYVVEQQGTQAHSFDTASFAERYRAAF